MSQVVDRAPEGFWQLLAISDPLSNLLISITYSITAFLIVLLIVCLFKEAINDMLNRLKTLPGGTELHPVPQRQITRPSDSTNIFSRVEVINNERDGVDSGGGQGTVHKAGPVHLRASSSMTASASVVPADSQSDSTDKVEIPKLEPTGNELWDRTLRDVEEYAEKDLNGDLVEMYKKLAFALALKQLNYITERNLRIMYRSQYDLLAFLRAHNGVCSEAEARNIFQIGKDRFPDFHKDTTYEIWIFFLINIQYIRIDDKNVILDSLGIECVDYVMHFNAPLPALG